jgi:ABC transport system ATP-binding/permease protein
LIARLMLRPADVLFLDEPTNDLDINSLEVLETSMTEFSGALVLVTHDRYLLDRVSNQILSLDGRGRTNYYADLSQWEASVAEAMEAGNAVPVVQEDVRAKSPEASAKGGLTGKESKELKTLEASIRAAEEQCKKASLALTDPKIATNAAELIERQKTLDAAQQNVEALLKRWEELEARR